MGKVNNDSDGVEVPSIDDVLQEQGEDTHDADEGADQAKPAGRRPRKTAGERQGPAKERVGDRCPQKGCKGRLRVLSTQRLSREIRRYLVCEACKRQPPGGYQSSPR